MDDPRISPLSHVEGMVAAMIDEQIKDPALRLVSRKIKVTIEYELGSNDDPY